MHTPRCHAALQRASPQRAARGIACENPTVCTLSAVCSVKYGATHPPNYTIINYYHTCRCAALPLLLRVSDVDVAMARERVPPPLPVVPPSDRGRQPAHRWRCCRWQTSDSCRLSRGIPCGSTQMAPRACTASTSK